MDVLDQVQDVEDAVLPMVTEEQLATQRSREGLTVVRHRGRYWQQTPPGFYRPVHVVARLTAEQATRPAAASWGFRACLTDEDADRANADIPVYLVSDLDSFDEKRLTSDRRRRLRRARDGARIVQLTDAGLLRDQGYDLLVSAHDRTRYGPVPTREEYVADLGHFGVAARGVVLGALFDGRLGGYLTGYAVDGTAYADKLVVASWALKTHISAGLTYEFIYLCRRTAGVREMLHGLHAPENDGLCRNKELLGLPLQRIPARLWMLPGMAPVIRRRAPFKYYRLTGRS